jgi:hypothetical protein
MKVWIYVTAIPLIVHGLANTAGSIAEWTSS